MAHKQHDSATQRLLKKLTTQPAADEQARRELPRAPYYDESFIADVLENKQISLQARALLAYVLTRADGFTISRSLVDVVGDDRITVFAALRELEEHGFVRHRTPNRWEFLAAPDVPSKACGARK